MTHPRTRQTLISRGYASLLADLKARVRTAQVKAAVSVNRELILLYWHLGREILRAQKAEGWGAKVVSRLAKDLAKEFPEMDGFSTRNLKRMRTFADAYSNGEIVPQPVAQLKKSEGEQPVAPILSQAVIKLGASPEPISRAFSPQRYRGTKIGGLGLVAGKGISSLCLCVSVVQFRLKRRPDKIVARTDGVLENSPTFSFLPLGETLA